MNKRILAITNTYYQLIFAIQMKLTLFQNDDFVLIITDRSLNAKQISDRLDNINLFSEVHFVQISGIKDKRSFIQKVKDHVDVSWKKDNRYNLYLKQLKNIFFDELLFYNFEIDIYGIYSILYEVNPHLSVSVFEEGILSYGVKVQSNYRRNNIRFVRNLRQKKDVLSVISRFYCFYPLLYNGSLCTCQVPTIALNGKCKNVLKKVFNMTPDKFNYQEKYIFFTSVYDFEGGEPIGEFEVVKKVSSLVGKDNLLVKTHPRDRRTIYQENGFKVDKNSGIPWEVIQLSGDFSDKVFLTATSGSVLAGSFMADRKTRTHFLYEFCNLEGNEIAKLTAINIQNLLSNKQLLKILSNVSIAKSIEAIL